MIAQKANSLTKVSERLSWRQYDPSDYNLASKWWISHNQAHLEKAFLPPTGVVITDNGEPIMMGWIYLSNSQMAQLGWVVSDPKLGPKAKISAMGILLDTCEELAKNSGCTMLQMFSDKSALTKLAQIYDFKLIRSHDFLVKYFTHEDEDV